MQQSQKPRENLRLFHVHTRKSRSTIRSTGLLAWVNRIDTFGNSWKTGLFGVINCCQASSDQILCQNTYSLHLNYSMYKEKTQHFYFKLSFSTSPFFAGLLTLLPLPLEEFFGSTFFRVIEVFSHPTVFLVDFRNDTIGQNLNNDILSD